MTVEETLVTICATAPLVCPVIFSPRIDSVLRFKPEENVNLSRDTDPLSTDS